MDIRSLLFLYQNTYEISSKSDKRKKDQESQETVSYERVRGGGMGENLKISFFFSDPSQNI